MLQKNIIIAIKQLLFNSSSYKALENILLLLFLDAKQ